MSRTARSESGQVVPFLIIGVLTLLLGIAALVIDVGAWYQTARHAQAVADAAALAGAQDLPDDPSAAVADAIDYASRNGVTLAPANVKISATAQPSDTIAVSVAQNAPIFFAHVLGINSKVVHKSSSAVATPVSEVGGPGSPGYASAPPVPLAVSPAAVTPVNQPTTLTWGPKNTFAPGSFGVLDLNSNGGTASGSVGDWIANGYPDQLSTGWYDGYPGNGKFQSKSGRDSFSELASQELTVAMPVVDTVTGTGGGSFHVIGFAAFHVTGWSSPGGETLLDGYFVDLSAPYTPGTPAQDFGMKHVGLVQ